MNRAIDICTCGKARADHGNATGHDFMPHPQPLREPEKGVREKLEDFIHSVGEIQSRSSLGYIVKTFTGQIWEINVFKRSSEGV